MKKTLFGTFIFVLSFSTMAASTPAEKACFARRAEVTNNLVSVLMNYIYKENYSQVITKVILKSKTDKESVYRLVAGEDSINIAISGNMIRDLSFSSSNYKIVDPLGRIQERGFKCIATSPSRNSWYSLASYTITNKDTGEEIGTYDYTFEQDAVFLIKF